MFRHSELGGVGVHEATSNPVTEFRTPLTEIQVRGLRQSVAEVSLWWIEVALDPLLRELAMPAQAVISQSTAGMVNMTYRITTGKQISHGPRARVSNHTCCSYVDASGRSYCVVAQYGRYSGCARTCSQSGAPQLRAETTTRSRGAAGGRVGPSSAVMPRP